MTGFDGLRMWLFTLVEFDIAGNAKIVKSFTKPAKNSTMKQSTKKKKSEKKSQTKTQDKTEEKKKSEFGGEEELW